MVRIIPYSAVKSTCKSFLGHVFDGKVSQMFKFAAEELLSALIATDLPLIHNMAKSILSRQGDYFSAMQLKNMQERISAWLAKLLKHISAAGTLKSSSKTSSLCSVLRRRE